MSRVALTKALRNEYIHLFATCDIHPDRAAEVNALVDRLLLDRFRYHEVAGKLKMPWFVVAVLHYASTEGDFNAHLHNGDPLTERTQHLPDGRPPDGEPPFRWEDSAVDALGLWHFDQWDDWSIAGTLFLLEGRGGWSYRLHHPEVLSPYLWNYSDHYSQGKYIADDVWHETTVAQACGVGVLLRRFAERGLIDFPRSGELPPRPLLHFNNGESVPLVAELQRYLNTLPGIFVKVDGIAGPKTSDAFHKLCGYYLSGDPREGNQKR